MRGVFDRLNPGLAVTDPQGFKEAALQQLGAATYAGAALWNFCVDRGTAADSRLVINPDTWVSNNSAAGVITLGAQPMEPASKKRILFHDERFSYPDEVAYRLGHEIAHGFLYLAQRDPRVATLRELNYAVREATKGERGLTALASLPFYQGIAKKEVEDTAELMAMYTWGGPAYIREYVNFITHPTNERTLAGVGVARIQDQGFLRAHIEAAVAGPLGL